MRKQTVEDYVRERWAESVDIRVRYGSRLATVADYPVGNYLEDGERTVPAVNGGRKKAK